MKEKEFIGYIEGYIVTTDIDSHGDRLSPEALEDMAKQIGNDPKLRITHYNHDMTQPMGYITEFSVETRGQWKGIKAVVGIYKTRSDLWQKIQSGEIRGFSYGAEVSEWEDRGIMKKECTFSVEVEPTVWHETSNMLSQMGATITPDVRKAIDVPVVIGVSTSLLALPGTIYGLHVLWQKFRKRNQGNKEYIKIKTTKRIYNFEDNTIEEITQEIETNSLPRE
jgi:hypothetical protein